MVNKLMVGIFFICVSAQTIYSQGDNSKEEIYGSSNTVASSSNTSQDNEPQGFLQGETITGSWWGLRNKLSETGLNFTFRYKGEFFSNLTGGNVRNTAMLDNYDLLFDFDLDKLINLSSTKLFVSILGNSGESIADVTGVSQGISNIEAVPTWKIYQLLIQKSFFEEHLSILFGLYDFNSEFDVKEASGIFINPSHGIGPDISSSGLNGPSIFPTTSLALRLKLEFENFYLQAAIFDGVPGDPENPYGTQVLLNKEDGLLLAGEAGLIKSVNDQQDFKFALGAWRYTSESPNNNFLLNPDSDLETSQHNYGLYLNVEKCLYNSEFSGNRILSFIRVGYANKNVNPVDFYFGGGIKFSGLFSKKENEFAFAIAYCHNSESYRQILLAEETELRPYEINIETTFSIKLATWFCLQPDVQYVINPAYCTTNQNCFLIGTRIILDF